MVQGWNRKPTQPKAECPSRCGYGSIPPTFPVPRYLSGIKSWESLKYFSLWWIAHRLPNIVVPFGMKWPLYWSSLMLAWGVPPITATGLHLRVSFITARQYGRFGSSDQVGDRSLPTTRSNSSCASAATLGKQVIARKKLIRVADEVSLPAPNNEPVAYAISRSERASGFPSLFSHNVFVKDAGASPFFIWSLTSSASLESISVESFARRLTSRFHGAKQSGISLRIGNDSAQNAPGLSNLSAFFALNSAPPPPPSGG